MKKVATLVILLLLSMQITGCGVGSIAGDISVNNLSADGGNTINGNYDGGVPAVITLHWSAPYEYMDNTPLYDLAGYKIYYGTTPDNLVFLMDIDPIQTTYVIQNDSRVLTGVKYYFAMTAYDGNLIESPLSEIVVFDGTLP